MPRHSVTIVRPKRPGPVLICRKCLKRCGSGKAIRRALKASLKREAGNAGSRPAKLVATACLGICPKDAVVTASAASLQRGDMIVIRDEAGASEATQWLRGDPVIA